MQINKFTVELVLKCTRRKHQPPSPECPQRYGSGQTCTCQLKRWTSAGHVALVKQNICILKHQLKPKICLQHAS